MVAMPTIDCGAWLLCLPLAVMYTSKGVAMPTCCSLAVVCMVAMPTCCSLAVVYGSRVDTWNMISCPSNTVYTELSPVESSTMNGDKPYHYQFYVVCMYTYVHTYVSTYASSIAG